MNTQMTFNPFPALGTLRRTSGRYSLFTWEGRFQVIEHTAGKDHVLLETGDAAEAGEFYGEVVLGEARERAKAHRRPHVLGIERKDGGR